MNEESLIGGLLLMVGIPPLLQHISLPLWTPLSISFLYLLTCTIVGTVAMIDDVFFDSRGIICLLQSKEAEV